jgi:hypothetical protein
MHWKPVSVGIHAVALVLATCGAGRAFGQECPVASSTGPTVESEVRTLEGRLIYHDGMRQWFELKLDKPICGQDSIQLIQMRENSTSIEVFRGCRIKSTGTIDFSGTGYFSRDTFQNVREIQPIGTCPRQPPFPDYSSAIPDELVRAYVVDMQVVLRPGDHPVIFHVRSAGKELQPWQAYASYWLTGDFVLYGLCGDGFVIDEVSGTPAANPGHFGGPQTSGDMAMFDPAGAERAGESDLRLVYTCLRDPLRQQH